MRRTVNKLIDDYKVVLDGLLVDLAEVRLADRVQAVAKLEDKCGIGVVPARILAAVS